jgi:ABC-type lipoprotein release transport system permease subunit
MTRSGSKRARCTRRCTACRSEALAGLIPARRAARVDPMLALRAE